MAWHTESEFNMNYEQKKKQAWKVSEQKFFEEITFKGKKPAPDKDEPYTMDIKEAIRVVVEKYRKEQE